MTLHAGWYLATFVSELSADVSPLDIGSRRLVLVRDGDDVRAFEGDCPHRGAHLGYGGRIQGDCIVCPFHGKHVTLGATVRHWSVAEYPSLRWGDALFVRLTDDGADDRGFADLANQLAATHPLVAALTQPIAAPAELIVENAFDTDHFTALHKVHKVTGMQVSNGPAGELAVEGEFHMMNSPWQSEADKAEARYRAVISGKVRWSYVPRFFARAFSPGVVVTEFGPADEIHVIVTAAVPTATGCVARVAVGVQAGREAMVSMLVAGSHKALGEDVPIWEHLAPGFVPRFDARDLPVMAFAKFCATFAQVQ